MDLKYVVGLLVLLVLIGVLFVAVILPAQKKGNQFTDFLNSQSQGGRMDYAVAEGVKDAQITQSLYDEKPVTAAEPVQPADLTSTLAPNEQPREWKKISKQDFVNTIRDAFDAERGSQPTEEQLKALYSITAFETGALKYGEIMAYNWNFGNIHLPGAKQFMLSDIGFAKIYDPSKHIEYVAAVKKYVAEKDIGLVEDMPYYWSTDSNGKTGPAREYYYTQLQAFSNPAEGLRRKISLLTSTYPGALDDRKLSAASDNGAKALIVAAGMKHGKNGYSYYEADESVYASGLKATMDDYDKMNID